MSIVSIVLHIIAAAILLWFGGVLEEIREFGRRFD